MNHPSKPIKIDPEPSAPQPSKVPLIKVDDSRSRATKKSKPQASRSPAKSAFDAAALGRLVGTGPQSSDSAADPPTNSPVRLPTDTPTDSPAATPIDSSTDAKQSTETPAAQPSPTVSTAPRSSRSEAAEVEKPAEAKPAEAMAAEAEPLAAAVEETLPAEPATDAAPPAESVKPVAVQIQTTKPGEAVNKLGQAPSQPLIFQGSRRVGSEPVPFFPAPEQRNLRLESVTRRRFSPSRRPRRSGGRRSEERTNRRQLAFQSDLPTDRL
jgi:hypothetical protein